MQANGGSLANRGSQIFSTHDPTVIVQSTSRRVRITAYPLEPSGGTPVTYVIAEPCVDVKDKSCREECPVDCIYDGTRMLYIQPDECVDCGACEPVCPVEAIYYEDDVPGQWDNYKKINTEFFIELGSPGGASKVGETNSDHADVTALAPKTS
jgi:ferredoxin